MADIMAVISAHLPEGESFDVEMRKPVVTVLRGVPAPVDNAKGALLAYRERLRADPEDEGVLLATYALACSAGERAAAERVLAMWVKLKSEAASAGFADISAAQIQARAEVLAGFLPTT
jgi:tellurite resistance protein